MTRVIAYDLTRLFIGPIFFTPRGIDRVDLALARHVFNDSATPNLGILPTPWGTRAYPASVVRPLLARLQQLWSERVSVDDDPQLKTLIAEMRAPFAARAHPIQPPYLTLANKVGRMMQLLRTTGIRLGRPAASALPHNSAYVNVGQLGLAIPLFHTWLEQRPDVSCVMMLHDIIPLEYPHLVSAAAVGHHARMVRTLAQYADCLLFNTAYAREGIDAALRTQGRTGLPSLVRPLPLPSAFEECVSSIPALDTFNYFLVVSTIEPRKNHELLIRVWKRLVKRMGTNAPHLCIVGALGYGADRILAELDHEPLLRSRIHIVSGLSSAALASLTLGATAMLSPSLAEGFGLPVLESSALGVPTIASDIAAHREIGGGKVILLPTDDEHGWESAILQKEAAGHRIRQPIARALTEIAYCEDVLAFVQEQGKSASGTKTNARLPALH